MFSRQQSLGDQLIIFPDVINPRPDFDQLQKLLETSLDKQDKQCLADLKEYIIKKEDSWILDFKMLNFIGALLEHRLEKTFYFKSNQMCQNILNIPSFVANLISVHVQVTECRYPSKIDAIVGGWLTQG